MAVAHSTYVSPLVFYFEFGWFSIWNLGATLHPQSKVQKEAASAVRWCKTKGGTVEKVDMVNRISMLGTGGVHPQNTERDFHTMLQSFARRFGVGIDCVKARMYDHAQADVVWKDIRVIHPDSMAAALYRKGEGVWRKTMFGGNDANAVAAFWKHVSEKCSWFQNNPCFGYSALEKLIPLSFYGDDIAAWKGTEAGSITILGWTSDLAYGNGSWTRYFPIAIYPEYSATPWTYNDIMGHIVPRVKDMTDPAMLHDWSEQGFAFAFSSLQGDLKWIKSQYHLHNYQMNQFCSSCGAAKKHDNISMTLADFREDASHSTSLPDLTDFHLNRGLAFLISFS